MRYKPGQTVKIKKNLSEQTMALAAHRLGHIGKISYIQLDPHDGGEMYILENCNYGWYEYEIDNLFSPPEKSRSRFELLDI